MLKSLILFVTLYLIVLTSFSCGDNYTPEVKEYIVSVEEMRKEKDSMLKYSDSSPLNAEEKEKMGELKYFKVDPEFKFESRLYEYEPKDTITISGTKGESRTVVRYGYLIFPFKNSEYRINVYEGFSRRGEKYYSIWFTDKTTGEDTYGVGRYIDFELMEPDHIYTVDFNLSYNPYCAYSPRFSCAIPTKEDFIDLAITAGEKNYH